MWSCAHWGLNSGRTVGSALFVCVLPHDLWVTQSKFSRLSSTGEIELTEMSTCKSLKHWLPVKSRIEFKILLLTYKALNGQAPSYLKEVIVP